MMIHSVLAENACILRESFPRQILSHKSRSEKLNHALSRLQFSVRIQNEMTAGAIFFSTAIVKRFVFNKKL
jgi:hypothetical protein